jgi:hypothetical protein
MDRGHRRNFCTVGIRRGTEWRGEVARALVLNQQ